MARQTQTHQTEKLVKVAKEGFALLDEFYGSPRKFEGRLNPTKPTYNHHQFYYKNQQPHVYRGPQVITVREPVVDSNQAAQFYGGMEIVDHTIRKEIRSRRAF
ncbi:hypothetical protein WN944_025429 [Citrus x changshan-huyou]|uniref:Uncharacterized protein n=1 Tax=Citrus x changshan-huyou TaxID=2935761 RepID=A0AAP0QC84_9ROSI